MNTLETKNPIPEIAAEPAVPVAPSPVAPAPLMPEPVVPAPASAPLGAPQAATPEIAPPPSPPSPSGLAFAKFCGAVGKVDVLSAPEEERFGICEAAIQTGCHSFLKIGLPLGEIRDGRLYRNDFTSFEVYCQKRWEFKRGKADYLISAARICQRIAEIPGLAQPQREWQLRPLLAVSLDNAELAWQYAVLQLSGGRPVTARMVKRALKDLNLPLVNVQPAAPRVRESKRELRRIVSGTMDELLGLITSKADHSTLLQKFEALHGQLQALLQPRKPKA